MSRAASPRNSPKSAAREDVKPDPLAEPQSAHETLKYHLLGPSLTKAGQDSVDQQKVSEVIYNASKGSKFFNNEEVKDKNLTQKIERILKKKEQLERLDLASDLRRADDYVAEQELSRDLSQTIVHIDCDAFYAAVEELDHPELKEVPMAVGKGVLTTCNYHARKFGCRSGMAGFVATKLCPQLICLPLNFEKYTAKAQEVRAILAEYDPDFESASIDEAYMNITQYCADSEMDPWDAVQQLRREVAEKTQITVSAGLAPNAKIAKVASNRNKPNGQFQVPNERTAVLAFMRTLPARKVNGIGRVFERELDAIGVKTCGDIYPHRQFLSKLFGEKAFHFLIQTYLGLGRTMVSPIEDHERKSVGTESTFRDMSDPGELRAKLRWTAEELEKDMLRAQVKGRTLCLKIKMHTYEVLTRQVASPKALATADEFYNNALPMLNRLDKEFGGLKLRLMGLRCTHLVSTKKFGGNFFNLNGFTSTTQPTARTTDDGWEVWPETEFEEQARQERQNDFDEAEKLSQELSSSQQAQLSEGEQLEEKNRRLKHGRPILPNPSPRSKALPEMRMDSGIGFRKPETRSKDNVQELRPGWECPVCARPQEPDERLFNEHVDFCLSRGTIKEVATAASPHPAPEPTAALPLREAANNRGRPKGKRKKEKAAGAEKGMKRLCWGPSLGEK